MIMMISVIILIKSEKSTADFEKMEKSVLKVEIREIIISIIESSKRKIESKVDEFIDIERKLEMKRRIKRLRRMGKKHSKIKSFAF